MIGGHDFDAFVQAIADGKSTPNAARHALGNGRILGTPIEVLVSAFHEFADGSLERQIKLAEARLVRARAITDKAEVTLDALISRRDGN